MKDRRLLLPVALSLSNGLVYCGVTHGNLAEPAVHTLFNPPLAQYLI